MSSTNRGGERSEADYYPTPGWCVKRLLEHPTLFRMQEQAGEWLEPCIGDGAIVRAVNSSLRRYNPEYPLPRWTGCDIRPECAAEVAGLGLMYFAQRDFTTLPPGLKFDVSISNPPFSIAMDIIEASMVQANVTIMLLRVNFLGSAERQPWFLKHKPDVYLLPNRPSFIGGKTDSIEYAWFVWGLTDGGHFYHLALTPKEERR
jgi:hypothetical protein